jgi:hypothetical protein
MKRRTQILSRLPTLLPRTDSALASVFKCFSPSSVFGYMAADFVPSEGVLGPVTGELEWG